MIQANPHPAEATPVPRHILDWVALIERLIVADRPALRAHFLALGTEDRRLRFGLALADQQVLGYVDGIDFDRTPVYGVGDGQGGWIGIGHLAPLGEDAELGLSVLPDARGKGLGSAIFRFAVAQASRDGARRLYMHFLTRNASVLSLARAAGMSIGSSGGESDAWLNVPAHADLVRQLIGEAAPV
ncbi:MAG: GNAT family N-acetyltransferase [Lautropia sp.]